MRTIVGGLIFANAAEAASAAFLRTSSNTSSITDHQAPLNSFETSCYYTVDTLPKNEVMKFPGQSYRGLVTSTVSGRTCQKWTSDHPWAAAADLPVIPDDDD